MSPDVALIIGTRPEAVKLAPIARSLAARQRDFEILLTAQHRSLLDQTLGVFDLSGDLDLDLMRADQALSDFAARALASLGETFRARRPSLVLVQGDTSTVFCAALAAFYEGIPVGHVEAGLRSFDMAHPFPEEGNRLLTSRLSSLHFAPTERAKGNLLAEGIDEEGIFVTGNTVVDSLNFMALRLKEQKGSSAISSILERARPLLLVTAHRRENFGEPMRRIFSALCKIARKRPEVDIVYPVHPNPRVKLMAKELLAQEENVHLLPPLHYLDFLTLMSRARLCLTDSGGVQEEAPSFGLPLLVLRETTERPEGIEAGCAELLGSDEDRIESRALELLDREKIEMPANPYGDGKAAERVADAIDGFLSCSK